MLVLPCIMEFTNRMVTMYYTIDNLNYNDDAQGVNELNSVLEASSMLAKDVSITEKLDSYASTYYSDDNDLNEGGAY